MEEEGKELFICMEEVFVHCVMFSRSTRCWESRVRPVFMEVCSLSTRALAVSRSFLLNMTPPLVPGECKRPLAPWQECLPWAGGSPHITSQPPTMQGVPFCTFFKLEILYFLSDKQWDYIQWRLFFRVRCTNQVMKTPFLNNLKFGLFARQNKLFKDLTIGSQKLWCEFSVFVDIFSYAGGLAVAGGLAWNDNIS